MKLPLALLPLVYFTGMLAAADAPASQAAPTTPAAPAAAAPAGGGQARGGGRAAPAPWASTPTVAGRGPAGWKQRVDLSTDASDPDGTGSIEFTQTGNSYHIVTPQAGVFFNPANVATGNFTLKGTFTQNRPSTHDNLYGFIFGGSNLEIESQKYTYFLISEGNPGPAGMANWMIKARNGPNTPRGQTPANPSTIVAKTRNTAIKRIDDTGKSTNVIEIRAQTDKVDFVVNGTVVHSAPRASMPTDGIWGIRSNHYQDITVSDLTMTKN